MESSFGSSTLFVLLLAAAGRCHDGQRESVSVSVSHEYDHGDWSSQSLAKERRYLLYDVNQGEGFNLRRDVYMRIASLVRQLRRPAAGHNFILVLPPWAGLYHWGQPEMDQGGPLAWSLFFDLTSLGRYVPVIELDQFVKETGSGQIEQVLYLQRYAEGWTDGKFEEKWDVRECLEADRYYYLEEGTQRWRGWFWSLEKDIWAKNFKCISVQGQSSTLVPLVLHENFTQMRSIMVDRAEAILHDHFGDADYWNGRRSMRFSKRLISIGDEFRRDQLNSNDENDNTVLEDDWRKMQKRSGEASGGPFLCVHWRRKDFIRAHGAELPSVNGTAVQIGAILTRLKLNTVFLATDAPKSGRSRGARRRGQRNLTTGASSGPNSDPATGFSLSELSGTDGHGPWAEETIRTAPEVRGWGKKKKVVEEVDKLKSLLTDIEVKQFVPNGTTKGEIRNGGVAIVDQWICTHARHFVGSYVSTFSFRIQEEREIVGFSTDSTFNRLCPDEKIQMGCEQPAKWTIVY